MREVYMKRSDRQNTGLFFSIFLLFFLTACGLLGTGDIDALSTVVAKTMTAVAQLSTATADTANSTPGAEIPTLTPGSTDQLFVKTTADNVNLREAPGRLFQVSRVLTRGSRVEFLGILPNGQWLKVRTGEGVIGWVLKELVESDFNPNGPQAVPDNVVLITGIVLDANNTPVTGVEMSIFKDEQKDTTLTINDGRYYLYLPTSLNGVWSLKRTGLSCESSIMGPNCQCLLEDCGTFEPLEYRLQFPLEPALYDFVVR